MKKIGVKGTKSLGAIPMPTSERQSLRIEKIDNGYLAHHSGTDAKGNYQEKTVFHPQKPILQVTAAPPVKTTPASVKTGGMVAPPKKVK